MIKVNLKLLGKDRLSQKCARAARKKNIITPTSHTLHQNKFCSGQRL